MTTFERFLSPIPQASRWTDFFPSKYHTNLGKITTQCLVSDSGIIDKGIYADVEARQSVDVGVASTPSFVVYGGRLGERERERRRREL